jgi:hypothetical protein
MTDVVKFPTGKKVRRSSGRDPTHLMDDAAWMTGCYKLWRGLRVSIWAVDCGDWRWGCRNLKTGDAYAHPGRYAGFAEARRGAWDYLTRPQRQMDAV